MSIGPKDRTIIRDVAKRIAEIAAEQEVRETLEIAKGCPIHIVMKDTSTFHGEAARTTRWCEMAKRLAIEAAS